ncbi:uncharacterized protein [Procambarus clarkii]
MLKPFTLQVAICVASILPIFGGSFLENSLTSVLQSELKKFHQFIIPIVTGVHINTPVTSVIVSAWNTSVLGYDDAYITHFLPPIPLISNVVELELVIESLYLSSDAYNLYGTHKGKKIVARGVGEILMENFSVKVSFKTQSYNLLPVSLCILQESLLIDLSIDKLFVRFEGADLINDDIGINGRSVVAGFEEELNKNARLLENNINKATCRMAW